MSETPTPPAPSLHPIPDQLEFFKQKARTLEKLNNKLIFYRHSWKSLEYDLEGLKRWWYQTETSDKEVEALIDVFNTELEDIALRLKDNIIEDLENENEELRNKIEG